MGKFSDDALADMRERLHDLMLGFAGVQARSMNTLMRADWALAARIEQLRRHPLVGSFDDELLLAVVERFVDPSSEARYLANRLAEVEAEIEAEPAVTPQPSTSAAGAGTAAGLPPLAVSQMEATIALIARDRLGIQTLKVRGWDSLDCHSCSVQGVRAALVEAYEEGWHAAS